MLHVLLLVKKRAAAALFPVSFSLSGFYNCETAWDHEDMLASGCTCMLPQLSHGQLQLHVLPIELAVLVV